MAGQNKQRRSSLEKEAREQYVTVRDGARLRVLEFASAAGPAAKTLVLVPGLATVFQSWQEVVLSLSQDFRILYFESREKASSILPDRRAERHITLHEMALDLKDLARNMRLDERPYLVLCSSAGGTLVIEALSQGWMRPQGAILVGPMVRNRLSPVAAVLTSCTPMALKNVAMPFFRVYLHAVHVNQRRNPEQFTKYVRAAEDVHFPKVRRLLWEMTAFDCTELLSKITTPCLIVGAATDEMHAASEVRRTQQRIPGASFVDLGSNQAAHAQPLVDAIRAFAAGLEKPRAL